MASVEDLKEQAIALGLSGSEVGQYVIRQQAYEREEWAAEQHAQQDKTEQQARQEKAIAEWQARQKEAEQQERLELVRLTAETERMRLSAQVKPDPLSIPEAAARPRLPVYQDGEDIATYLTRFERVAELLQLDVGTYDVRLGCLLTGKAAELYVSLSPEITCDYQELKRSLLAGFQKTSDGYRLDFRNAKIREGENYTVFSSLNPSIPELVGVFQD